jgi:hypothetical protein
MNAIKKILVLTDRSPHADEISPGMATLRGPVGNN